MEPRLYIVMREDLWDMNPGKAMAQAAHAQADFCNYVMGQTCPSFIKSYEQWIEDRNFGVTTVLSATLNEMKSLTFNVEHAETIIDPTYPWRNYYGQIFTSKEVTCMWVFAIDDEDLETMSQFKLHK